MLGVFNEQRRNFVSLNLCLDTTFRRSIEFRDHAKGFQGFESIVG